MGMHKNEICAKLLSTRIIIKIAIQGFMVNSLSHYDPSPNFGEIFQFALKWTPRAIVAGLAGYYCLGVAYSMGIMAAIDRIAMRILLPSLGYMGVAAFMPTFQWYSAWTVRVVIAIVAGFLYDLIERILRAVFAYFYSEKSSSLIPIPLHQLTDIVTLGPV